MDAIKTSLIIGIGLTLYYLLLQWPVNDKVYDSYSQEQIEIDSFIDSERSLSEPLAPLSQTNQGLVEVANEELDLSLIHI